MPFGAEAPASSRWPDMKLGHHAAPFVARPPSFLLSWPQLSLLASSSEPSLFLRRRSGCSFGGGVGYVLGVEVGQGVGEIGRGCGP